MYIQKGVHSYIKILVKILVMCFIKSFNNVVFNLLLGKCQFNKLAKNKMLNKLLKRVKIPFGLAYKRKLPLTAVVLFLLKVNLY